MKITKLIILLSSSICLTQTPNTEVFLFNLNTNNNFELTNFKNISNNKGYDNQPSFLNNHTILYAANRNGQTDIVRYYTKYDSKIFVNFSDGSEYSPLKIPDENAVSAVRLDKEGTQVLRRYNLSNGESEILIDNIVIGYHCWYNSDYLVSSVLQDSTLALYVTNMKDLQNHQYDINIGRSLHKIPNTELVSYISKMNTPWEIRSLNPKTGQTRLITKTLHETEDMCWLPDGTILMGKDDALYTFNLKQNANWKEVFSLKQYNIINITRVIASPDGSKLAVVGELEDTKKEKEKTKNNSKPLKATLDNIAWIAGNWKGKALGGIVEENWSKPSGNSMMATFKLIKNNEVVFYEIEIIREINNTLILQLKHFDDELKGWESKDNTVDFPLKSITTNKVIFEGMTFEKINETQMNVYVDVKNKDGSTQTLTFIYTKD